jgi:hypothetical protein
MQNAGYAEDDTHWGSMNGSTNKLNIDKQMLRKITTFIES